MSNNKIWRNDDVSYETDLRSFQEVQRMFKKHIVLHTVALICNGIEKNPKLIEYINANNIDVQIHCWDHVDFPDDYEKMDRDMPKCIETIEKHFRHRPLVVYPPHNKSDAMVEEIAKNHGLTVSAKKVSLSQYIRFNGRVGEDVINFHSWCFDEVLQLSEALKIYSKLR